MLKPEEAGEEFLRGEPYVECHTCKGRGERQVYQGSSPRLIECNGCFGHGTVPRPAYFDACRYFDKPMPTRKPSESRRSR